MDDSVGGMVGNLYFERGIMDGRGVGIPVCRGFSGISSARSSRNVKISALLAVVGRHRTFFKVFSRLVRNLMSGYNATPLKNVVGWIDRSSGEDAGGVVLQFDRARGGVGGAPRARAVGDLG